MGKITRHAMKWREIGQPFPKRVKTLKTVTSFIVERMMSIIKVIKGSLNYI